MLFNSLEFLFFFCLFFLLYSSFSLKSQNVILVIAGIVFYSTWSKETLPVLFFCVAFNYFGSHKMIGSTKPIFFLVGMIIVNLVILFFFKYIDFTFTILNDILQLLHLKYQFTLLTVSLPVGISFYTFHNISYIVDIYHKRIQPAKSLLSYTIYELFFPLLLAGPIERAEKLLPQIDQARTIQLQNISDGMFLLFIGLFKKMVIADTLSLLTTPALDKTAILPNGFIYVLGPMFGIQMYADFSGYTDIARGIAKLIGFELTENFHFPYFASNPSEFWKRWHITLSSWLKDYVYIPLGGNKQGLLRQNRNLMIVWILGGVWHGATYGYLIWGFYCGLQVVLYTTIKQSFFKFSEPKILFKILGSILTFYLFTMGLILFRVQDISHLSALVSNGTSLYYNFVIYLKFSLFVVGIMLLDFIKHSYSQPIAKTIFWYCIFPILFLLFCLLAVFEKTEFLYFRF
jgi:alginate O-acetyltransferase complex protein AlgI